MAVFVAGGGISFSVSQTVFSIQHLVFYIHLLFITCQKRFAFEIGDVSSSLTLAGLKHLILISSALLLYQPKDGTWK